MKLALTVLSFSLLNACHVSEHAAEPPRPSEIVVVPRSHQIPPGHAADVRKLFASNVASFPITVAGATGATTQFINPHPSFIGSDRFVVGATPEIHAELDTLLAAMAKSPMPPGAGTYVVTYWAIEAMPSSETQVPADLAELEPTLKGLGALGTRRFRTIDRASTRALDGSKVQIKSRALSVEQTLSIDPDGLELKLLIMMHGSADQLDSEFQLAVDRPIVLGQTAAEAGSGADAGATAGLVLYIVRAQRAE